MLLPRIPALTDIQISSSLLAVGQLQISHKRTPPSYTSFRSNLNDSFNNALSSANTLNSLGRRIILKLLREKFNFCEARQYGIISFPLPFHLPDVNHLLTEKHWLQLIVTTAGEGTVESVLAATWVTGTSDVTLKVKYIPVWKIKQISSYTGVVLFRAFERHWRNRTFSALHCNKESPIY